MEEGTIIAAQILDGYYFYRVPVNADGCTRVVIFPLPCKESYGIPYINFAFINCGTFHAIFISLVNVTGLKP